MRVVALKMRMDNVLAGNFVFRARPSADDLIGRVADKWTMIILEALTEHGVLRFSKLATLAHGISQKMLTQTLRQMERDGLLTRTVFAVVPPKVEYRLTELGLSLSAAFCDVWLWAEANLTRIETSRLNFDDRLKNS